MKNNKLFIALVLFLSISPFSVYSQTEYMINGGFEIWDNSASDWYPESIEYALGWHNLVNTSDVKHPNSLTVSGIPRSGQACGRFAAPTNGMSEFCYGTTQQLTAGQTYEVSFWVRKDDDISTNRQVGLAISETIPSITLDPFSTSIQPIIKLIPTNTQYVKANGCFTALVSGTHYVTIGPFGGTGTPENLVYTIDDVSVKSIPNDAVLPNAQLNINQPSFCNGDNIIIDGTSTTNETAYILEITNLTYNNNQDHYSGIINGQVGTFNVSNLLVNPLPGNCYRATLTAIGVCNDITSLDFCYDNPNVNFVTDGTPVCEGVPIELTVTGDNGWTYSWSNGQSGTGLKTIQITPTSNNSSFSVTVTTLMNCTHTETINLTVHSNNNLAPWMNGIQNLSNGTLGSDPYTVYVQQGELLSFSSDIFNDYTNEILQNELFSSIQLPSQNLSQHIILNFPENSTGIMQFIWNTGFGLAPRVDPGIYEFTLKLNDGNVCGNGINYFTFKIIVFCDQCPTCVSFENRIPSNSPLPPETKVGVCIEAGISQPVQTGNANVLFQAGASITLGEFFQAGPGFEALIEQTTCVTDCEDCCDDWTGFTFDAIPDPPYVNFNDNNPDNDIFQITDVNHPFCAFGAQGFEFYIISDYGNTLYSLTSTSNSCCAFESPSPENPISHSSIWWDGYVTNIFGNTVRANDGVYTYYLKFFGCGGQQSPTYHGYLNVGGIDPYGIATNNDNNTEINSKEVAYESESVNGILELQQQINVVPNPTRDYIEIVGISNGQFQFVKLLDDKGLEVLSNCKFKNNKLDVSSLSPGTYFVTFTIENYEVVKKFIKL